MTKRETAQMIFLIKTLYPNRNGFEGKNEKELEVIVSAWSSVLEDLPFDLVKQCLKVHSSTNQFAPSISEIRKIASDIQKPGTGMTADTVWNMVLGAVRRYGYARKEEAIQTLPEELRDMADRWFEEIGQTEMDNLGVTRGQFMAAWKVNSEREKFLNQLQPTTRNLIKGFADRMELSDGSN